MQLHKLFLPRKQWDKANILGKLETNRGGETLKVRDPYIDNARFILIVLVVFGHLVSPLKGENEWIYLINNLLASFRMPALIMLTGIFAKGFHKGGYVEKITIKLLVPYLFFQVFYLLINHTLTGYQFSSFDWFKPFMGMWFLLSVYCWNLLLFIFTRLKHPIFISVILGIAVGYMNSGFESYNVMRTFVFFPFFLIGFYFNKESIRWFKKDALKVVSVLVLFLVVYVMQAVGIEISRGLLLGKQTYESLGLGMAEGFLLRILFYLVMGAGILLYLPWVPTHRSWFTVYGQRTAYVYLFHFALIKLFHGLDLFSHVEPWMVAFAPFLALVVAVVLASKPMLLFTKPFVEGTIVKIILDRVTVAAQGVTVFIKSKILRNSSYLSYLVFKK